MVNVTTERIDDILSADVEGRIDGSNVVQFEEAVRTAIEDSDRAVIMNFEKLVYISSAGLRAILLTAKSLQNRDAKLLLCSLSDRIREVFEISGFDKILPIHPSKDEALASLDR
ncbi:MAG: STAS domain-containing protein [Rhodospirillaceae bacterium]|nr:STAS domain-containing protein [Rhodospirillaceae bacterium]